VIVLWSSESIRSDWVKTEADEARRRGILVPAVLDDVMIPLGFRRFHAANLVDCSGVFAGAEFDGLIEAVTELLGDAVPLVPGTMPGLVAGQTRVNPADGLTYVYIPPGTFTMGCSPGDSECFYNEKPPHTEQIARAFWLSQTPVTQAAWEKVMGDNPSHFKGAQLPVESVDWIQAVEYCGKVGGRLPTEIEWEYAARAGTTRARYGDLDAVAWYLRNSGGKTHPVGLKQANAWGLFDMLGNVLEWTVDNADNYNASVKNLRGGSWSLPSRFVRASDRFVPTVGYNNIGFRCVGEFR
jgi:formylglycine-generating enzyme required for sulfatase activity